VAAAGVGATARASPAHRCAYARFVGRPNPVGQARVAAFVQGLQQSGWTDGRNIRIDYRWSAGNADLIRKLAMEMIALGPDVVMAPHR
jgi:putative tryptophan/tyrosine transport system substrate-binding protein